MRLGVVNVNAMLRNMTARQFSEWEAYARLEPFNEKRADYRAASIAQMIFNMAVSAKDRKSDIEDFTVKYASDEEETTVKKAPQTFEEQIAIAKIMVAASQAGVKEK